MTYRAKDRDVLDAICWKHYGPRPGAVEAVLDANPGLADRGPVLAAGVLVHLPELPEPLRPVRTVRLWD